MDMRLLVLIFILVVLLIGDRYARHFLARQVILLGYYISGSNRVGLGMYAFLFLPGTVVHEMAHLLTAIALGLGVGKVRLIPEHIAIDEPLGSVEVESGKPWRLSFVGMAPFFFGLTALLAIVSFISIRGLDLSLTGVFNRLTDITFYGEILMRLVRNLDSWASLGLLYLAIAVSNHMYPSRVDLKYWYFQLITVGVFVVVGFVLHRFNWFGTDPIGFLVRIIPLIYIVFIFTICLNIVGGSFFWLTNKVIVGFFQPAH